MGTYIERYLQGEHEAVWMELTTLGAGVRSPEIFNDACKVATETMRRVRFNCELLVRRLSEIGYQFGYIDKGLLVPQTPLLPPADDTTALLEQLNALVGPLPLSLQAWYEMVGEVHFVGVAPWNSTNTRADALIVELLHTALGDILDYDNSEEKIIPYQVVIAPDEYHKEDISGGPAYSIALPGSAMDAFLEYEWHKTTFVSYLRECLQCGGFPGLARDPNGLLQEVRALTFGLLAF